MIKPGIRIIAASFVLFLSQASAQESGFQYGKKGSFELSTGFSGASSTNAQEYQHYSIALLPYANHFILKKFFFRYEFGLNFDYSTSSYYKNYSFGILPGLGLGYNFQLSERWHFNISMGYSVFYAWSRASYTWADSSSYSGGSQYVNFYPEIKYLITEKWALAILVRAQTNIPSMIYYGNESLAVSTSAFIVASYIF